LGFGELRSVTIGNHGRRTTIVRSAGQENHISPRVLERLQTLKIAVDDQLRPVLSVAIPEKSAWSHSNQPCTPVDTSHLDSRPNGNPVPKLFKVGFLIQRERGEKAAASRQ
jgi:hypothetical protein